MDGMIIDPNVIQARKRKELLLTLLEKGESIIKDKFIADIKYNDDAIALADDLTCVTIVHLSNYIHKILSTDKQAKAALVTIVAKILDIEIEYTEDTNNNGLLPVKKE